MYFKHLVSIQFSSVAQSCPTLHLHGLQHARIPYSSPTPRACSNLCPSSWWCHPTISFSVIPFPSCLQSFPRNRAFSNVLRIRWPKYWNFSFSISFSNEYSGLISFGLTSLISLQSALNKKSYYFLCFVDEDTRSGKTKQRKCLD